MSLENPTTFETVIAFVKANKIVFIVVGLIVLLVIVAMYMTDCGSRWSANRAENKDRQAIANKTNQIANETANIEQMKQDRAQHVGELQVLTNSYVAANVTDERAKAEVQQAAANLASIVNSNANAVPARVEDVNRKLDQLGIQ
jgi:ABC-type multidrug transport system fused ATPase/permease subunit